MVHHSSESPMKKKRYVIQVHMFSHSGNHSKALVRLLDRKTLLFTYHPRRYPPKVYYKWGKAQHAVDIIKGSHHYYDVDICEIVFTLFGFMVLKVARRKND